MCVYVAEEKYRACVILRHRRLGAWWCVIRIEELARVNYVPHSTSAKM